MRIANPFLIHLPTILSLYMEESVYLCSKPFYIMLIPIEQSCFIYNVPLHYLFSWKIVAMSKNALCVSLRSDIITRLLQAYCVENSSGFIE